MCSSVPSSTRNVWFDLSRADVTVSTVANCIVYSDSGEIISRGWCERGDELPSPLISATKVLS